MNSLSNNDDHSQDRDKEPVIPSFLLGGPRWPNVTASSAQERMPTAGERIAALEAEVAALRAFLLYQGSVGESAVCTAV